MDPQNSRSDLQNLVDCMLPIAEKLLKKHKGFNPFSGVIDSNGKPRLVVDESSAQGQPSADPIDDLVHFLKKSKTHRAVAICTNNSHPSKGNSIILHYEDSTGSSCTLHVPYTFDISGPTLGEIERESAEKLIYE